MKNAATPENSANLLWQPQDRDGFRLATNLLQAPFAVPE
jgi:hypothetical protein